MTEPLPFAARLILAWVVFFRVLFDGVFARRVDQLKSGALDAGLLPSGEEETGRKPPPRDEPAPSERASAPPREESLVRQEGALLLLSVLQREGRLVDFVRQDIATFDDADVGTAARVVHEGCRKALDAVLQLTPVRADAEGAKVTVEADETGAAVKLTGDVRGAAPFSGTLRHKGWKATQVSLPSPTKGHDMTIVCPAEVEL